jgi:hypothetical protein
MRTIYSTTRAGWFDTLAIAKAKWLQQVKAPSSAASGMLSEPTTTQPQFHDGKLRTVQKILTALQ